MSSNSPDADRSGLHPALSVRQGFALLEESSSVRNLLRETVSAIRDMRYISIDGDSVFTQGSIGVEKAMKVMLGCKAVGDRGAWPTQSKLSKWGHDIERLNARLLTAVDEGLQHATASGYAAGLAAQMKQSRVIPLVFATFARYGKTGRFHHLDILATDQPGEHDQPSEYWEQVELTVQQSQPQFREVPFGDNDAFDAYQQGLRNFIADELEAWWFCIHRLGVQGCFGDLGKKIGWEIWEVGRPTPNIVDA